MIRIKKALKKTLVRMKLNASPETCFVLETVLESKRVPRTVGYNTILTSSTISELSVSSVLDVSTIKMPLSLTVYENIHILREELKKSKKADPGFCPVLIKANNILLKNQEYEKVLKYDDLTLMSTLTNTVGFVTPLYKLNKMLIPDTEKEGEKEGEEASEGEKIEGESPPVTTP
mmetsp:Transcript_2920/g.3056  ORF Transcript_2920/g.3056 Transcript_2920/m.3056 type:complete len:175 (+) Transcript_2920:161-685(+)